MFGLTDGVGDLRDLQRQDAYRNVTRERQTTSFFSGSSASMLIDSPESSPVLAESVNALQSKMVGLTMRNDGIDAPRSSFDQRIRSELDRLSRITHIVDEDRNLAISRVSICNP